MNSVPHGNQFPLLIVLHAIRWSSDSFSVLSFVLAEFFWAGQHWVSAAVLSLPLAEGGQGLVCIKSQVHTFRLQTLQRFLYADPAPQWCTLASLLLRQLHDLGYDRQLFWIDLRGIRLPELPVFYRDLLKTRSMFDIGRDAVPTEGEEFSQVGLRSCTELSGRAAVP